MGPENPSRAPSAEKFQKICRPFAMAAVLFAVGSTPDAQSTSRQDSLSTPITSSQDVPLTLGTIIIPLEHAPDEPITGINETSQVSQKAVELRTMPQPNQTPAPEPRVIANRYQVQEIPRDMWDRLAEECESSGNWSANTGNEFYGGLQFTLSTWRAYGGGEFANRPDLATREQQIIVAERVGFTGYGNFKPQGMIAWPYCSLKLGLR